MKAAIPYENGQIFQHFGHTAQFKLYELQGGKVVSSQVVDTNGSGHGALGRVPPGPGGGDPGVRRHWGRCQDRPGPGGHPAVPRGDRGRGPGGGGPGRRAAGVRSPGPVHPTTPTKRATPAATTAAAAGKTTPAAAAATEEGLSCTQDQCR